MINRNNLYTALLIIVAILQTFTYNASAYSIGLLFLFFVFDKDFYRKIRAAFSYPLMWVFCLYFFVQLLGFIHTENIDQALKQINGIVLFVVVPLVLYGEDLSKKQKKQLFFCFIGFLAVFSFWILYHTKTPSDMDKAYGIHPLSLSNFFLVGILLCMYLHEERNINKWLLLVLVALFSYLILKIASRISIIALLALFIFCLIHKKHKKVSISIILSILIFLPNYKNEELTEKIQRISNLVVKTFAPETNWEENFLSSQKTPNEKVAPKIGEAEEGRLIMWHIAYNIFKENIWLGVGTGDANDALYEQYKKSDFKQGIEKKFNAHNQYLQESIKMGIIGLVFFSAIFITLFIFAIKNKNYLLLMFTIIILISGLTESIFERYHNLLFFSFFIPLFQIFKERNIFI